MKCKIDRFSGKFRWLSNFWPSPVVFDGLSCDTIEHAYQAAKTIDMVERVSVTLQPTPGKAKQQGQKVTLRPDWEQVKQNVMLDLLRQKFAPGSKLAEKLLATGDQKLVEGNHWHDQFWGDCRCPRHRDAPGRNMLGRALMAVRQELREGVTWEELGRGFVDWPEPDQTYGAAD